MRALFLPDTLMALLYKEQRFFQEYYEKQFYKTIPYFQIDTEITELEILPPIEQEGFILRPCKQGRGGFILGSAGERAKELIKIAHTTRREDARHLFKPLYPKKWYSAEFTLIEIDTTTQWTIGNPHWHTKKPLQLN